MLFHWFPVSGASLLFMVLDFFAAVWFFRQRSTARWEAWLFSISFGIRFWTRLGMTICCGWLNSGATGATSHDEFNLIFRLSPFLPLVALGVEVYGLSLMLQRIDRLEQQLDSSSQP